MSPVTRLSSRASLASFLAHSDSSTITYNGRGAFEAVLAARICWSMKNNADSDGDVLVHLPLCDGVLAAIIASFGVQASEDAVGTIYRIYQGESLLESLAVFSPDHLCAPWPDPRVLLRPRKLFFSSCDEFGLLQETVQQIADACGLGGPLRFDWDSIRDNWLESVLVTTDWNLYGAMKLLGQRALLVTGPGTPADQVFPMVGLSVKDVVHIKDRVAAMPSCPCLKPRFCREHTGPLPCLLDPVLDSLPAIARGLWFSDG